MEDPKNNMPNGTPPLSDNNKPESDDASTPTPTPESTPTPTPEPTPIPPTPEEPKMPDGPGNASLTSAAVPPTAPSSAPDTTPEPASDPEPAPTPVTPEPEPVAPAEPEAPATPSTGSTSSPQVDTGGKSVVIYTTPTCQYCKAAKEFFREHDIQYTEHDVTADQTKRQEMIDKSGQMGVPVIFVGDEMVVGFDKDKLSSLLGIS